MHIEQSNKLLSRKATESACLGFWRLISKISLLGHFRGFDNTEILYAIKISKINGANKENVDANNRLEQSTRLIDIDLQR